MKAKSILQASLLAAAALLVSGATRSNWDSVVAETDGGHRIGNPDAKVKLTEFVSYTCPHCFQFSQESEAPLKVGYVMQGQVSVEIRHLIRDPVDLTVAVLVNCGPAAKFPKNHTAFMLRQDKWIGPLTSATQAQQVRWRTAGAAGRRAVASDFGFYKIMEGRGYRRADVDRCLADEPMVKKLAETSAKDWQRPGIGGTPAFAINGNVMPGTNSWPSLERQLKEFL